jgi:hypothetical protein
LETGKMQKRQPKAKKSLAFSPYHKNSKNFWQFQCCFEVLVSVLSASWRIEFFRGLMAKQIVPDWEEVDPRDILEKIKSLR